MLALAVLLLLQQSAATPARLAAVVRQAHRAAERGRADSADAAWRARLARDSLDPETRLGLATLALYGYRYAEADRAYQSLLDGPDPAVRTWAHLGLGFKAQALGANSTADSLYRLALEEARHGADTAAEFEALLRRASTALRIEGPAPALALADAAGPLRPRNDAELEAEWRCTRALVLAAGGRPEAGGEAATGARLAAASGARRQHATCLAYLARDLARQGEMNSAVALEQTVADEFGLAHDLIDRGATLQWRGYELMGLGLYGLALPDLRQALADGRVSGSQSIVAWSLLNLALISLLEGDGVSARGQAAQAESLFTEQGDGWGLAALRGTQGAIGIVSGDFPAARRAFADQVARSGDGFPEAMIQALTHLAALDLEEAHPDSARRRLEAALAVARHHQMLGVERSLDYDFGRLALATGALDQAERYFLRDLATMKPDQESRRYPAQTRLAEVYARRGELGRAESTMAGATDSLEAWRSGLSDQALRLHLFDLREADLVPNRSVEAVLGALAASGRAAAAFGIAERRRTRELLDRMTRLAVLRGGSGTPVGPVTTAPVAEELRAALPDEHTAVLEFVGGRPDLVTTLFVVSRSGLRSYPIAGLDSLVIENDRLTELLQAGDGAGRLPTRLGALLLGPALAELPTGITDLIIVPDGVLHDVPFDALESADGKPLIERFAITLAPSTAVLTRLWRTPRQEGPTGLLAMGDPAVAHPGSGVPARGGEDLTVGLTPLPASRAEARTISGYAAGAELRLGDSASESFLRHADLAGYRVLHFATHAYVDEGDEARTVLALAPGGSEDGMVGPADLASLQLNADLVVLSGCRTARGRVIRGEGVQGLTSPLLQAGARSVAATIWPIGDRAGLRMIEEFYDGLAAGASVGEALHAAKLAARTRGEPPSVWAAFTLVGDPTVTVPLRRPASGGRWWVLVATLVAASYGAWMVKRKSGERRPS